MHPVLSGSALAESGLAHWRWPLCVREGFQIMWARRKAPYHNHAPTTAQRKGQGLSSMWAGKTQGPLFSNPIGCPAVFTVDVVLNRLTNGRPTSSLPTMIEVAQTEV